MTDNNDDKTQENLTTMIADHVHSKTFFDSLIDTIDQIKGKPDAKAKLMFNLMDYVLPKIKATEPDTTQGIESITINFLDAIDPNEEKEADDEKTTSS